MSKKKSSQRNKTPDSDSENKMPLPVRQSDSPATGAMSNFSQGVNYTGPGSERNDRTDENRDLESRESVPGE